MINNLLDPAPWRAKLLREGRVQVADYLQESAAERLHLCLSEQVEWTLALRDAEGPRTLAASDYAALSPPQRTALFAEIAASARREMANCISAAICDPVHSLFVRCSG